MTQALAESVDYNTALSHIGFTRPEYLLLAPIALIFIWYVRRGGPWNKARLAFTAVRTLIVLLTVAALASPVYYESRKVIQDVPPVTVLVDASPSMGLYSDTNSTAYLVLGGVRSAVGNLTGDSSNVKIEFFSDANKTTIGDALYRNMVKYSGESSAVVLLSDGVNNYGRNPLDLAVAMAEMNSTLYTIKPGKDLDDLYLKSVIGDRKIPSNINYDLIVKVGNTGFREVSYEIVVYVDGIRKFNKRFTQGEFEKDIALNLRMDDVGVHEIRVELDAREDAFPENNVFYKTVEVVEKPKLLLVTANRTSPMQQVLDELYDVELTTRVDNDYSKYAGVVFDNIHSRDLDRNRVNKIKKYVLDGNGVAFIGGGNSFEYGGYNNSFIENILPVKSTEKPVERRRELAIVFMIDISESTEYGIGAESKIDVEKAVVLKMLRALNSNDSVGVLAFNNVPYTISPLSPIGPKYTDVEDRVLRLRFGGGTDMLYAVQMADNMLKDVTVDKYLLIVSDGVIRGSRKQLTVNKIAEMADRDIKTYTVGVGFDTDEHLMVELARVGGGQYFSLKSDPQKRLKMVFGEAAEDKDRDLTPIEVADEYHFITQHLTELENVGASVRGFNKVYEKNVAQMLLSTRGGRPVLTVWRFGLGRIAAVTTDNGLDWSEELVKVDSGRVYSGLANWIIGDLEKGKEVRIKSSGIHLGETAELVISSASQPKVQVKNSVSLREPNIILTRTSLSAYSASFTPDTGGFYGVRAVAEGDQDFDAVAVNYPLEYNDLRVDEDTLRRMSAATGGRLYTPDEVNALVADILDEARETSEKELRDTRDLWIYLAIAAFALYFLDAATRRLVVLLKGRGEDSHQSSTQPTKPGLGL